MAETKMYGVRFLPVLMVIALVCVAAAAGLLAFGGQDMDAGASSVRSMNELLALSQKIPAQANAALNGDAPALEGCGSRARAIPSWLSPSAATCIVRRLDRDAEAEPGDPQLAAKRSKACTRRPPKFARWCRS